MLNLKKTKIIATLGPSVTGKMFTFEQFNDPNNAEKIKEAKNRLSEIYDSGVNAIRLNFSHGTYEEQLIKIQLAREVANEKNLNIGFILDTKGPEIRVFEIENGEVSIENNSIVKIFTTQKIVGNSNQFSVYDSTNTYNMARDVKVDDIIFVDDGKLKLIAKEVNVDEGYIITIAKNQHNLKTNKRINLPNADYSIPFMSEKDYNDILFAIENKFDFIAASFVNNASNVHEIRKILSERNANNIQIISKIETMNAINAIDEIIDASDSIMVARGDLGLEIPYYEVPHYEKYIIKACRHKGKSVIIATQMLDSLETKMQATRAEVTDVFFAVERGSDCTMLSGETANGLYPVNAVEVMATINKSSEKLFDYDRALNVYFEHTRFSKTEFGKKVKNIAKMIAPERDIFNTPFEYGAIIYIGNNKEEINTLSNIRLAAPIFLVTDDENLKRYFSIHYGVYTTYVQKIVDSKDFVKSITKNILSKLPKYNKKTIVIHGNKIYKC